MKTSTRIMVLLATLLLSSTFFVNIANAYSGYVGQKISLPNPSVSGILDATVWESSDNSLVSVNANGVAQINKYFSGQLTITCMYNYHYFSGGKTHYVINQYLYYDITCIPSKITLNKSEITLNVGEEAELTYTNSSGYNLPFAEWSTSNESVAKLIDSSSSFSKNKVIGYKSVTIDAIGEGQCIIYCDGKNGSNAVTCKVTVIDNRWVKANVPSGGVKKGTKVTLSCTKPGATIYYTTDESEPSKYSNIYTSPIEINKSMTLKAKAYLGSQESATSQWKYAVSNHLDGDIFSAKTIEGVEVSYKAYVTAQNAYCLVSSGISNIAAIDRKYTGHLTIPEYADGIPVRGIDERAFYNCKVTSISLPTYTGTFYSTSFSIGKYAFEYSNLTSLTIPKKIRADIKEGAFRLCTALETVTFEHNTLENIGIYAFEGCTGIKTIYSYVTDPPKLLDKRFEDKTLSNAILYVPKDNYDNYRYSTWNKFKNIVAMGSTPPSSEPTNISVYPTSKTIKVGESFSMSYTLTPSDAQTTISWSSDNSNIATVSSTGVVKGIKAGTTYIYAKTSNGKLDYCMVTVESDSPAPSSSIEINATNFPDANFRNFLLEQDYGKDGIITSEEIKTIIFLWLSSMNINTLKGIEYFTELIYLFCYDNPLNSLDVSNNTALILLNCGLCKLTVLDLSKNIKLTGLYCNNNQLTSLDVSTNSELISIECHYNQLSSLDVSRNKKLEQIICYGNCIKEAAMDNLINSLTNNTTGNERKIYVFDYGNSEGNVCTKDQVAAIKAKGWTPYDVYDNEYLGSDPSGINGIELDGENTKRIYDLSGKPLSKPRKGINIIDGKKVIVR